MYLVVGVFPDQVCEHYGYPPVHSMVERCEVLRHCRWVDEVLPEAPWQIDERFASERRIDYVVFDEGATVSPTYDKVRVRGYDEMKRLGECCPNTGPQNQLTSNP